MITSIQDILCERYPIPGCCDGGEEIITGLKIGYGTKIKIIKAPFTISIFPNKIIIKDSFDRKTEITLTEVIPSQFTDIDELLELLKIAGGCCCGNSSNPTVTDPENFSRTAFVDKNANGGAIGDGHKRFATIQAAIAALGTNGGRVIVGAGTFVIDSPIVLPDNVSIVLDPTTILESGGVIFEKTTGKSNIYGGTLRTTSGIEVIQVGANGKLSITSTDIISISDTNSAIKTDGKLLLTDVLMLYTGATKPAFAISQFAVGGGTIQNMSGSASNANAQSDANTTVTCQDIVIDPEYIEPRFS